MQIWTEEVKEIFTTFGEVRPQWHALVESEIASHPGLGVSKSVCTENLIRVDAVMESPKLAE
jgi:hypothetical protein